MTTATFITEAEETKLHQIRGTLGLITELSGASTETVLAANLSDATWLLSDQLTSVLDSIKQRDMDMLKMTNPQVYAILQEKGNHKPG